MAGIFFFSAYSVFFPLWLSNTRLEFVCEINSGDQRWVNISINKSQNRKEPLNDGEAALGVCLSVCSADVGETGVSVSVSLFLLLDLLSLMSLPAFIPWRFAVWPFDKDAWKEKTSERREQLKGQENVPDFTAAHYGESAGCGHKKMTTCQSRKEKVDMVAATQHMPALPLTLFPSLSFSSGWHQEWSTSFRPFRVISTSDHTEDKKKITSPEIFFWNTVKKLLFKIVNKTKLIWRMFNIKNLFQN